MAGRDDAAASMAALGAPKSITQSAEALTGRLNENRPAAQPRARLGWEGDGP